jgi:hypothetical protein
VGVDEEALKFASVWYRSVKRKTVLFVATLLPGTAVQAQELPPTMGSPADYPYGATIGP